MLKNIFGADDIAEKDQDLWKYFLETDSYEHACSGKKLFIIGRKGSGKSAICQQLRRNLPRDTKTVIFLSPEEDDQFRLQSKLAIIDRTSISPPELDFHFRYIWRTILKCELARLIANNPAIPSGKNVNKIRDFVKEFYQLDRRRGVSRLVSTLIDFLDHLTINIGMISLEKADKRQDMEISNIKQNVDALDQNVVEIIHNYYPKGIYILADNLDEFWDNSKSSLVFFRGLISAVVDIAEPRHSVFPIFFISTDVLMQVAPTYRNIDKIHQYEEKIKWKRNELIELISKRIQAYLPNLSSKDPVEVWNEVFTRKVGVSKSFKYILDRTLLRPRDILQFCRLAAEKASHRGSNKIEDRDIKSAEYTYSDWKAIDLQAEHYYSLPFLKEIMERGFKRKSMRWKFDSFLRHLSDLVEHIYNSNDPRMAHIPKPTSYELMEKLYSIGLIKAVVEKRRIQSAEDTQLPSRIDHFEIHPAFWKHLRVRFPNLPKT